MIFASLSKYIITFPNTQKIKNEALLLNIYLIAFSLDTEILNNLLIMGLQQEDFVD